MQPCHWQRSSKQSKLMGWKRVITRNMLRLIFVGRELFWMIWVSLEIQYLYHYFLLTCFVFLHREYPYWHANYLGIITLPLQCNCPHDMHCFVHSCQNWSYLHLCKRSAARTCNLLGPDTPIYYCIITEWRFGGIYVLRITLSICCHHDSCNSILIPFSFVFHLCHSFCLTRKRVPMTIVPKS